MKKQHYWAFELADDVLYQGVKGVTDLMVRPGLINLDFADVKAVMDEMEKGGWELVKLVERIEHNKQQKKLLQPLLKFHYLEPEVF